MTVLREQEQTRKVSFPPSSFQLFQDQCLSFEVRNFIIENAGSSVCFVSDTQILEVLINQDVNL